MKLEYICKRRKRFRAVCRFSQGLRHCPSSTAMGNLKRCGPPDAYTVLWRPITNIRNSWTKPPKVDLLCSRCRKVPCKDYKIVFFFIPCSKNLFSHCSCNSWNSWTPLQLFIFADDTLMPSSSYTELTCPFEALIDWYSFSGVGRNFTRFTSSPAFSLIHLYLGGHLPLTQILLLTCGDFNWGTPSFPAPYGHTLRKIPEGERLRTPKLPCLALT